MTTTTLIIVFDAARYIYDIFAVSPPMHVLAIYFDSAASRHNMCVCVCVYERASGYIYAAAGDVYISGPVVLESTWRGWVYVKFKARRQLWRNLVYYEIVEVVRRPAAGPFWPARAPPPLLPPYQPRRRPVWLIARHSRVHRRNFNYSRSL